MTVYWRSRKRLVFANRLVGIMKPTFRSMTAVILLMSCLFLMLLISNAIGGPYSTYQDALDQHNIEMYGGIASNSENICC